MRAGRANFAPHRIKHIFFINPLAGMRSDFRKDGKFRRFRQNALTGSSAFFVSIPFCETTSTDWKATPVSKTESLFKRPPQMTQRRCCGGGWARPGRVRFKKCPPSENKGRFSGANTRTSDNARKTTKKKKKQEEKEKAGIKGRRERKGRKGRKGRSKKKWKKQEEKEERGKANEGKCKTPITSELWGHSLPNFPPLLYRTAFLRDAPLDRAILGEAISIDTETTGYRKGRTDI